MKQKVKSKKQKDKVLSFLPITIEYIYEISSNKRKFLEVLYVQEVLPNFL